MKPRAREVVSPPLYALERKRRVVRKKEKKKERIGKE